MREIKFRGKRIDNGEWVYGCLTRYSKEMSYITVDVVENEIYQVHTKTVGQILSMYEVYEGDVVVGSESDEYGTVLSNWLGEVYWDEEKCGLYVRDDTGDVYTIDDYDFDVVVGNIHDNPELMQL